ncbi:hypothetical protein D9M68_761550 [compost metagenome]
MIKGVVVIGCAVDAASRATKSGWQAVESLQGCAAPSQALTPQSESFLLERSNFHNCPFRSPA